MRETRCAWRLRNDLDRTGDDPVYTQIADGCDGADLKRCYVETIEVSSTRLPSKIRDPLVELGID